MKAIAIVLLILLTVEAATPHIRVLFGNSTGFTPMLVGSSWLRFCAVFMASTVIAIALSL